MFNPFKKQTIYLDNARLVLARENLEIQEAYKSLDAKDKKALSIFSNDVKRMILRGGVDIWEKYDIAKTTLNNYKNENKDEVVNDLIVELISDREEDHWEWEQEKEKEKKKWSPKKAKDYPIYALVIYGVVVSVFFTMTALFQFFSLTPDGLRFGHKICIEEGLEMGRMVCEAWEENPSSFSPVGEGLFDMLKRIGIMIGVLWFPYMAHEWYKQRKVEGLHYLELKKQYEEIENSVEEEQDEIIRMAKKIFDNESDNK